MKLCTPQVGAPRGMLPMLALAATATLLLATPPPAADAADEGQKIRELRQIKKRIAGLGGQAGKAKKKDEAKGKLRRTVTRGAVSIAKAKRAWLENYFGAELVRGVPVVPLTWELERIDSGLSAARRAKRERVVLGFTEQAFFAAGLVNERITDHGLSGCGLEGLVIEIEELRSAIRDRRNVAGSKFLRRATNRIEKDKRTGISCLFGADVVCGITYPTLFRFYEGIDLKLDRAIEAARADNAKQAKAALGKAAKKAGALANNLEEGNKLPGQE